MPKPVRLDPEAVEEIDAGVGWYEAQRPGLGRQFFEEVRNAVRTLAAPGPECRPAFGVAKDLGVRRKLVRRFPYVALFIELPTAVRVIAVAHAKRHPRYWTDRV